MVEQGLWEWSKGYADNLLGWQREPQCGCHVLSGIFPAPREGAVPADLSQEQKDPQVCPCVCDHRVVRHQQMKNKSRRQNLLATIDDQS